MSQKEKVQTSTPERKQDVINQTKWERCALQNRCDDLGKSKQEIWKL